MEPMIERCCGIDVHQKQIVCCILSGPLDSNRPKKFFKSFGTRTADLRMALEWIESHQVTDVFMESTGQYWIPVFNIFSEGSFNQILANPQRIKGIPNRKTDIKDAEWIAQLGRSGLIPNSYIPSEEVLQLRYLTRRKLAYSQKRTQVKNEVHNILQRANIKLTSYLSDIFSKTGQALLRLFINGEVISLEAVTECMHGKVKAQPSDVLLAMEGKISKVDRYLLGNSLEEYRLYTRKMEEIEHYIQLYCEDHFPQEYALLQEIPGVKENTAAVILGEIGPDVSAFSTVGHLAAWAGLSPGSYESAGIKKASRTTRGNKYLKTALVTSGGIATRSKDKAFIQFFNRLSKKGSKMKARVACAHKLLRIIYKVLTEHVHYDKEKALGLRQQILALNN